MSIGGGGLGFRGCCDISLYISLFIYPYLVRKLLMFYILFWLRIHVFFIQNPLVNFCCTVSLFILYYIIPLLLLRLLLLLLLLQRLRLLRLTTASTTATTDGARAAGGNTANNGQGQLQNDIT